MPWDSPLWPQRTCRDCRTIVLCIDRPVNRVRPMIKIHVNAFPERRDKLCLFPVTTSASVRPAAVRTLYPSTFLFLLLAWGLQCAAVCMLHHSPTFSPVLSLPVGSYAIIAYTSPSTQVQILFTRVPCTCSLPPTTCFLEPVPLSVYPFGRRLAWFSQPHLSARTACSPRRLTCNACQHRIGGLQDAASQLSCVV